MDIYNINLMYIREYYNQIYEYLCNDGEPSEYVVIDKSLNEETIVGVYEDNNVYYFNSRYNDDEFSDNWKKSIGHLEYQELAVVFGTSNFRCVKKLLKDMDGTAMVLLYEPDREVFKSIIRKVDITDILSNGSVMLCVNGMNDKALEIFAQATITYERNDKIKYFQMWNYTRLYKEQWDKVVDKFYQKREMNIIQKNTYVHFSKDIIRNKIINCYDMVNQYALNQLQQYIKNANKDRNTPAIVVSAGPSLDKNILELKKAKNKAFIVVVDTAIRPVMNNGIRPDIVVTVDPIKDLVLFMHPDFRNVPLLVCDSSNPKVFKVHDGKRFYFRTHDSFAADIYKEYRDEELEITETGGSVANDAFSLAVMLGFKNIILVGQDLAYPNNKRHASSSYGKNEQLDKSKTYFEVEDIYGGKVLTEINMNAYRQWFENKILLYDFLNVIDATEGGAKINGTTIMTLSDAINEYCTEEMNYEVIIDDIPKCYNAEEQREIHERLDNISNELEDYKKRIKNGLRLYDKLSELARKGKNHTSEYSTTVRKIGELSSFIEENALLGIAAIYGKAEEYEVMDEVYDKKETLYDDVKDAIVKGERLFKLYIKSIDEFKDDIYNLLNSSSELLDEKTKGLSENIINLKDIISQSECEKIDVLLKPFYENYIALVEKLSDSKEQKEYKDNMYKIVDLVRTQNYNDIIKLLDSELVKKVVEG